MERKIENTSATSNDPDSCHTCCISVVLPWVKGAKQSHAWKATLASDSPSADTIHLDSFDGTNCSRGDTVYSLITYI